MYDLFIEQTKSTPKVLFDHQNAKLSIQGQSYPENAFQFYEPIIAWLDDIWNNCSKMPGWRYIFICRILIPVVQNA